MKKVRTRIAPTPSGFLHIGNALSLYITAALAKKFNADILLRIDDLDTLRIRDEFIEDVFNSLRQLEIGYQEGPSNLCELKKQWSQQNRVHLYEQQLNELMKLNVLYACSCSRKDLDEIGGSGSRAHKCRTRQLHASITDVSWRIRIPDECVITVEDGFSGNFTVDLNREMPDFVIRRKDGIPSYQLASLVDDVHFMVNLIVRGEDLKSSTAAQLYLASLLGLSEFTQSQFYHHPLISEENGTKLSKSEGALSLKEISKNESVKTRLDQEFALLVKARGEGFSDIFV